MMMIKKQSGAALIVVLSLLTISLMVGLSSIQSSQIDERLAGNYRAQSQALMHAESSVSQIFSEILEKDKRVWVGFEGLVDGFTWADINGLAGDNENLDYCAGYSFLEGEGAACYIRLGDGNDLELASGDYIISMGRAGQSVSSALIVALEGGGGAFDLNSALTVLGGIRDIESN